MDWTHHAELSTAPWGSSSCRSCNSFVEHGGTCGAIRKLWEPHHFHKVPSWFCTYSYWNSPRHVQQLCRLSKFILANATSWDFFERRSGCEETQRCFLLFQRHLGASWFQSLGRPQRTLNSVTFAHRRIGPNFMCWNTLKYCNHQIDPNWGSISIHKSLECPVRFRFIWRRLLSGCFYVCCRAEW